MNLMDRIILEPGKRGGKPSIRGLRIRVYDVLEYLAPGMAESQVGSDFPDLKLENIGATLAFGTQRERRLVSGPLEVLPGSVHD